MKTAFLISLLAASAFTTTAWSRTWTDTTGRKIEADLVSVQGDKVVLSLKGKNVPLDIGKLSEADKEYIATWQEEQAEKTSGTTDASPKLEQGGKVNIVEEDLSAETIKEFSKSKRPSTKLKLAIALPSGFDPSKHQKVMWVSAAINKESDRVNGNIRSMNTFAPVATKAGWVVIAADGNLGNPREEDNKDDDGNDLALHREAIAALTGYWPNFKSWEFACCGSSGGAKASFYRVGDLLDSDLNVTGMFLSGCNEDMTDGARSETRFKRGDLRKVRVFLSNGKTDHITTQAHAEALAKSMKSNGYGEIRLELVDGGHEVKPEEFAKALQWFATAPR